MKTKLQSINKWLKVNFSVSLIVLLFMGLNAMATVPTLTSSSAAGVPGTTDIIVKSKLTTASSTTYFVVLPKGAATPTAAQVKAGKDANDAVVADNTKGSISNPVAATEYSATVSGYLFGTSWDVFIAAEEISTGDMSAVTKKTFGFPTMPVPQTLPYTQNFSNVTSTNNVLPDGWAGWRITSTAPTSPAQVTAPLQDQAMVVGTAANTGSGCYNFDGKIGAYSTAFDHTFCLAINTTGKTTIRVTFDAMTIRNNYSASTGYNFEMELQYRVGNLDPFTKIDYAPAPYVNTYSVQETGSTGINIVEGLYATLPAACDNQANVQIRWANSALSGTTGVRPNFAIDNVGVIYGGTTSLSVAEKIATAYVLNGQLMLLEGDIFNSMGVKVASVKPTNTITAVKLNRGIYIVKSKMGTQKIVLR